jgi:hypothetical protein
MTSSNRRIRKLKIVCARVLEKIPAFEMDSPSGFAHSHIWDIATGTSCVMCTERSVNLQRDTLEAYRITC